MRKIKVIFNPKANRGRNTQLAEELRQLTEQLGGADWVTTQQPGHATELAAQAAIEGYQRVISMGGDGTIQEIINGLMRVEQADRSALAIVPVGSGNDFIRGVTVKPTPAQAIEQAFESTQTKPIDIGCMRINDGPLRYWVNVVGIGFDAAVTKQSKRTRVKGKMMYFVSAVRTIIANYNALSFEMELDGQVRRQNSQMLTIGNGTREGGGFITNPDARVDDGLLDYVVFEPVSRAMMVRMIPEVMRGTHGKVKKIVHMGTFKAMKLVSEQPMPIHTDGELVAIETDNIHKLEVRVIPAAINLVN
jgi:YegS/Rv2252/BmrU family lipid kinase